MRKTTYEAQDKKEGMTIEEVMNALRGHAPEVRLKARLTIRGRIKEITVEQDWSKL